LLFDCFKRNERDKNAKAGKSRKAQSLKTGQLMELLKIKEKTNVFPMKKGGGRFWIRTREGVSQQIYSLPPLATWVTYHSRQTKPAAG
jgi:hypothetical protein